jgi:hypothetical protein
MPVKNPLPVAEISEKIARAGKLGAIFAAPLPMLE